MTNSLTSKKKKGSPNLMMLSPKKIPKTFDKFGLKKKQRICDKMIFLFKLLKTFAPQKRNANS